MGGSALSGMITGAGQWAGIIGNVDAAKKEANIADQLIKNSNSVTDICKDIVAKNQTALKLNAKVVANLDQNSLRILDQSGIDVRGMSLAAIESLTKQYEGAFDEKSIRESFKFDEDAFKKSYSESHQNASEAEIAQAMSNAKQANEDRINKAVNEAITERANIVAELQHISSQATKVITDDMPDRIFDEHDTEIDYGKFTAEREQVLNVMKDSNRIIEDNPNSVTIESIKSGVKDSRGQDISAGVNDQMKEGAAASAFKNIKKGAEAMKSTFQNEINAANRLEANQKSNSSDK